MANNYMAVICDNKSSKHSPKHPTPLVQEFVYREHAKDELGIGWTDNNHRRKKARVDGAHVNIAKALVGNEKYKRELHQGQQHRESYSFQCGKCGAASNIRAEKMYAAFTKLRDLGFERVSLATLNDIAARI